MRGILITGCIRSGTTWLGRVLSTAKGTVYLHEPMNPGSHWNACLPLPRQYTMLTRENGGLYEGLAQRLARLDPVFPSPWTGPAQERCRKELAEQLGHPRNHGIPREQLRCVWKDPLACYSAEWLAEVVGLRPVLVVRHPVQVAKSLLRLDWAPGGLAWLLRQPHLVARFHPGGTAAIEELQGRWRELPKLDRVCAQIRVWLQGVARLRELHPGWTFVDYHRLVAEPRAAFTELFTGLGLEPTEATYQAVGGDAVGSHDPSLAHQQTIAPIPSQDPMAPGEGVSDWAAVHSRWFADVTEELLGPVGG